MDIQEANAWIRHAQTALQVGHDPYGAEMLNKAVGALRARLAEVEKERHQLVQEIMRLVCLNERVEAQRDGLKDIAKEFCNRVDRGLVRSKYTYNKFKEALTKLEVSDAKNS